MLRSLGTIPALALAFFTFSTVAAQSLHVGADFVSRYVWRGSDFGESFSVQPALTMGFEGLEAGAWGSYSLSADGASSNELDLWAAYTFRTPSAGSFSVAFTDYYFPYPGAAEEGMDFFNYNNGGEGAHWLEPAAAYSGPSSFPITVFVGMMLHNDPDQSLYAEVGYPISLDSEVEIGLSAGASLIRSDFYGTEGFAFLALGLSGTKALKITDSFSVPISVTYILNPNAKTGFLVFGISV